MTNLDWINYHLDIVCLSDAAKILSNLDSEILFDCEELNDYKEPLVRVLQSTKLLTDMLGALTIEHESLRSYANDRLFNHVKQCLRAFQGLTPDYLHWISNDAVVFNSLVEAICCSKLLGNDLLAADLALLNIHPILISLLTKEGWIMINDLFTFNDNLFGLC